MIVGGVTLYLKGDTVAGISLITAGIAKITAQEALAARKMDKPLQ